MKNENYFTDLFESIPDYRKIVFLVVLFQNDKDLLHRIGFNESNINRLNLGCKNFSIEQHEEYLDYDKIEEESIVERFNYK